MFSESLARLAFFLFLLLSTPIGFHHQYADPGIPPAWKFIHSVLTYGVGFPSMLTAFTVVASLELGARARGGKGYLRWIFSLNWGDPSYAAQNLAMILFAFGGLGGITNASYNLNLAVHNTTWVPGHFHLTVGSGVTLTFFGICYWLVPKLSGKQLSSRWLALGQAWTWFIGMILFSNGYHALGLYEGAPRRSMLGAAPYASEAWRPYLLETGIGVGILLISAILFFVVILTTVLSWRKLQTPIEMPVAEPLDPSLRVPSWLDNWGPWLYGAIGLVIVSYGPMLINLIANVQLTSPGFKVW
jgi:cytochrome c oxidase subunit 1